MANGIRLEEKFREWTQECVAAPSQQDARGLPVRDGTNDGRLLLGVLFRGPRALPTYRHQHTSLGTQHRYTLQYDPDEDMELPETFKRPKVSPPSSLPS